MVSLPSIALILARTLPGALLVALGAAGSAGEAWAQPVSNARLVPSPPAALAPANSPQPAGEPGVSGAASVTGTASAPGSAAASGSAPALSSIATTAARVTNPANPAHPANIARGSRSPGVAGRVTGNSSALAAAGVYAYQLADLTLHKVQTDPQGNFLFANLPAGLYKIIASKPGFLPVVVLLTRTAPQAYQFLELQLAQRDAATRGTAGKGTAGGQPTGAANPADADFWALRASIPPDVLRDIETADSPAAAAKSARAGGGTGGLPAATGGEVPAANVIANPLLAGRFRTEVQAMTGIADVPQFGVGQVSTGKVGVEGQLGGVQVGLSGRFWTMTGDSPLPGASRALPAVTSDGQTSSMQLDLEPGPSSKITVDSLSNRLVPRTTSGAIGALGLGPIGLDHYQVSWSQALGESSRSDFAAQYTSENNYNRQAILDPADIPDASRNWRVEGAYTTATGDSGSLQAGFRYSELQLGLSPTGSGPTVSPSSPSSPSSLAPLAPGPGAAGITTSEATGSLISPGHQTIDLFSRGSSRLQPAFMVEYGLVTTLQDGSLSLTPQGGLVLQLGDGWQARGTASHRVYQESSFNPEFLPTLFNESDLCQDGSRACYELNLSNHLDHDNSISLSAIERIVGQTLRLYFSDVVFDRLESLYLVSGDRLPELRLVMNNRPLPQVRTSFQTSVASGGGGTFLGGDGRTYRNQVRYVIASLDTRFLPTATGIFLAFQHMNQDLAPMGSLAALASGSTISQPGTIGSNGALTLPSASGLTPVMAFDRIQVTLSQDLNFLLNLASEWALQVNMELSRGLDPDLLLASTDNQLHRRFLGGIAVKF
jgi:hypothetical protein